MNHTGSHGQDMNRHVIAKEVFERTMGCEHNDRVHSLAIEALHQIGEGDLSATQLGRVVKEQDPHWMFLLFVAHREIDSIVRALVHGGQDSPMERLDMEVWRVQGRQVPATQSLYLGEEGTDPVLEVGRVIGACVRLDGGGVPLKKLESLNRFFEGVDGRFAEEDAGYVLDDGLDCSPTEVSDDGATGGVDLERSHSKSSSPRKEKCLAAADEFAHGLIGLSSEELDRGSGEALETGQIRAAPDHFEWKGELGRGTDSEVERYRAPGATG